MSATLMEEIATSVDKNERQPTIRLFFSSYVRQAKSPPRLNRNYHFFIELILNFLAGEAPLKRFFHHPISLSILHFIMKLYLTFPISKLHLISYLENHDSLPKNKKFLENHDIIPYSNKPALRCGPLPKRTPRVLRTLDPKIVHQNEWFLRETTKTDPKCQIYCSVPW